MMPSPTWISFGSAQSQIESVDAEAPDGTSLPNQRVLYGTDAPGTAPCPLTPGTSVGIRSSNCSRTTGADERNRSMRTVIGCSLWNSACPPRRATSHVALSPASSGARRVIWGKEASATISFQQSRRDEPARQDHGRSQDGARRTGIGRWRQELGERAWRRHRHIPVRSARIHAGDGVFHQAGEAGRTGAGEHDLHISVELQQAVRDRRALPHDDSERLQQRHADQRSGCHGRTVCLDDTTGAGESPATPLYIYAKFTDGVNSNQVLEATLLLDSMVRATSADGTEPAGAQLWHHQWDADHRSAKRSSQFRRRWRISVLEGEQLERQICRLASIRDRNCQHHGLDRAAGVPRPGSFSRSTTISECMSTRSSIRAAVHRDLSHRHGWMFPLGAVDTPADGGTVSGSVGVTGWVVDDVEATAVRIYRMGIAGDAPDALGAVHRRCGSSGRYLSRRPGGLHRLDQ